MNKNITLGSAAGFTGFSLCAACWLPIMIAGSFDFAENISKEKATLDLEVAKNMLKDATNKADISVAKDKMKLASLRLSVLEHL